MPDEFWLASLSREPTMTQSRIKEIVAVLSPYTVLEVVYCSVDSERLPGNYKFCPLHGNKLAVQ